MVKNKFVYKNIYIYIYAFTQHSPKEDFLTKYNVKLHTLTITLNKHLLHRHNITVAVSSSFSKL